MRPTIAGEHVKQGDWIVAPMADIKRPQEGRICLGRRWWLVTEADEVLFFRGYYAPQCNGSESIATHLSAKFGPFKTTPRFIEMAFVPHRCE